MANAIQDVLVSKAGAPDETLTGLKAAPVAASTTIYAGTMVGLDTAGNAGPLGAGFPHVQGICERQVDNSTGAAGDKVVEMRRGEFALASTGTAITKAKVGLAVYASDDHTVTLAPGGPFAGIVSQFDAILGVPYFAIGLFLTGASGGSAAQTFEARAATTGNITLSGAQTVDGVALVAGDIALVKAQTTAAENALYIVQSGAWTLVTNPDSSSVLVEGLLVSVSAGTVNADTIWQLAPDLTTWDEVEAGDATPQPVGTATAGTSTQLSRQDHVHAIGNAVDLTVTTTGLADGDFGYISAANTVSKTDADAMASSLAVGANEGTVGKMTSVAGMVIDNAKFTTVGGSPAAGAPVYLAPGTEEASASGKLTATAPTTAGQVVAEVGYCLDPANYAGSKTAKVVWLPKAPIQL